jgi:hypothetical protein
MGLSLSPISLIIVGFLSLWLGTLSISAIIITGVIVLTYGFVTFRFPAQSVSLQYRQE